MSGRGMDWTPAMIDTLTRYWASGMVVTEIARLMSREFWVRITGNAVVGKAHRLGLPARPSPIRAKKSRPVPVAQQASALAPKVPKIASRRVRDAGVSSLTLPRPLKVMPAKVEPLDGLGILSEGMKTSHCQWPLWDGALPPLDQRRHCGCAAVPGRPYCAGHALVAYVKVPRARPEGMLLPFNDRASEALRAKFSSRVRA